MKKRPGRVYDLRSLSRELQRVNRTLRRIGGMPALPRPSIDSVSVRAILDARRLRDACFGPAIGELAWAILLEAYAARLDGRLSAMTSLGAPAGIARSTAHRWVAALLARGLLARHADPADERIVLVGLADDAAERIRAYLDEATGRAPLTL
jgi:DNA-binding MarR family transcriptional regulator